MTDELAPKLTAEFIGTFFLLFIGVGSIALTTQLGATGYDALLGIALAHGVALAIGVSLSMNISGGHINPAVTIAALATGRIDGRSAAGYIVAQLLAGVVALGVLVVATPGQALAGASYGATLVDTGAISLGQAVALEAALTFVLVCAVWGTGFSENAPNIGGFGIGLAVFIDILVGGPLTGASMNPARTFAPNLIAAFSGTADALGHFPVYIVGPIVGALIAGVLYEYGIERPLAEGA